MEDFGSVALRRLLDAHGAAVKATHGDFGDATALVDAARLVDVMRFLRDDADCQLDMLTDVTAVDYLGEEPRFEMVYHLYSLSKNKRLRVKARVGERAPATPICAGSCCTKSFRAIRCARTIRKRNASRSSGRGTSRSGDRTAASDIRMREEAKIRRDA
jgi:Respiratory-chain NADH dehydrogenase, 30 Kd subunit